MKQTLRAFTIVSAAFLLTLSTEASISCDRDSFLIKTETGRWGYDQIRCHITGVEGINTIYEGNLSNRIETRATKRPGGEYLIELILDASSTEKASFRGKVEVATDSGEILANFPAVIRIGQEDISGITLSEEVLRFTFDRTNYEECHTIEIRNTGDKDLDDLKASITSWETKKKNNSWITISDISEDTFKRGRKKDLEICVNNRDNKTETRTATIRVSAGDVKEEIRVTLTQDVENALQKKYDLLQNQYEFLQKAYNQMRIYKDKAEELNASYQSLLNNYSVLNTSLLNLSITVKKLENETCRTTTTNTTSTTQTTTTTIAEPAQDPQQQEETTEEERFIETLRKQKEAKEAAEGNKTNARPSNQGILGYALALEGPAAYAGIAVPAIILLVFGGLVYRKVKRTKIKKPAPAAAAGDTAAPTTPADMSREAQKEALKKLLMQKLAEKAAEKK